jgi:sortase A
MYRVLAHVLVLLGIGVFALSGVALAWPELLQPDFTPELPRIETAAATGTAQAPRAGQPIGVIEIPRLGLSSVVLEGEEPTALLLGVGHLSDTPLPWRAGNSVFAAHRDTYFRPLAHIRRDDLIRFRTADAALEYRVLDTKIVAPGDLDVLAPTSSVTLTLITCYPFTYVGAAPQRFVVRAERRAGAAVYD